MDANDRPSSALVWGLLVTHGLLLLVLARLDSVTVDEAGHLPAGLWHWRTGSLDLYRVNPPFPRMLATLPVLAAGPDTDVGPLHDGPGQRLEWLASARFASRNVSRYNDFLFLSRLAGVAWSLLGGYLIWRWASELFGGRAGLLALTLWCFGPNVLAHAHLLTPDIPATVAGLAASYVFWRFLRAPSWPLAWFTGLLLGVAQLTKFTWLILYGLWPALALLFYWRRGLTPARAAARLTQVLLIVALSLVVLNLGYGFQGSGRPLGDYTFVSRLLAGDEGEGGTAFGNRFRDGWLGRLPVPLPADYVLGIDLQRRDFEAGWPSYLGGEWGKGGQWYFYLYTLSLKVPLGSWGLFFGALLAIGSRRRVAPWRDEVVLWLPPAVLLVVASAQTGLNYLRYVLPIAPFLFVALSRLGDFVRLSSWRTAIPVSALTLWAVTSSLTVYPHALSYFNELAGGPGSGHRHLVDSNLDWGQDLFRLKRWLAEHPEVKELGFAYFGQFDPRHVGIPFHLPPFAGQDNPPGEGQPSAAFGPHPGYFAVSVHFVQGGTFRAPDGRGRWRLIPLYGYRYFQEFRPIAKVGCSIWVYHISPEEADDVRQRLGLPPLSRCGLVPSPPR